ncbi:MAG: UMP kinase [Nanoarchaeota archaeon]|nr:UMP kinase [Nanoarchaeota archaeon]
MKKETIVISLGGSLIIPDNVNYSYLKKFKQTIKSIKNKKFVIVTGGGSLARKYISALSQETKDHKTQSLAGISATRTNARFVSYFFGQDQGKGIPHKIEQVKSLIKKQNIVFCGGLEYKPQQTSDGTAAQIAAKLKAKFINITNVSGLYTDNPKTNKNAKFIPTSTWKNFHKRAASIKYKPGQHFVLDQNASSIIMKNKVPTYIIGENTDNLKNLILGKKFKGTTIEG